MRNDLTLIPDSYADPHERYIPLGHHLIGATSSGTAETFYTVPDQTAIRVEKLSIHNLGMVSVNVSLYAIPLSGTLGDANAELKTVAIPAGLPTDISELVRCYYEAGTVLKVFASIADALVIRGMARQVL